MAGKVSPFRVSNICIFAYHCVAVTKHEGLKGLTLNLKVSHVLTMQSLGGYKIDDMAPLKRRVSRSRAGFPKWIPVRSRFLLMRKDISTIRFWTTLLSMYRILDCPPQISLGTITSAGVD